MRMTRSLGLVSLGSLLLALAACTNQAPPSTTPPTQQPTIDASASPMSPAPTTDPLSGTQFRDDFDAAALDETKWKFYQRSGLSIMKEGRLELLVAGTAPSFPYLLSRQDIIPEAGPFYFELAYEVKTGGRNTVSLGLDYLPAESPEEEALTAPFMRTQPFYLNLRTIFKLESGEKAFDGQGGWAVGKPHVLRVEGNDAGQYRVLHDGFEVATFESKRRPTRFWVGNYPLKNTTVNSWPHMAFDYVAAGTLAAPQAASPYPTPTPSVSPTATP